MSTKRDKKEEEKKRRQNAEKPIGQNKKLAENEQLSRTNASSRTSTPNYTRYYNPEPNDQLSRETGLSVKAQKSTPTEARIIRSICPATNRPSRNWTTASWITL